MDDKFGWAADDIEWIKVTEKSFPDHRGIPGHQGGSLPRDEAMPQVIALKPKGTMYTLVKDTSEKGGGFWVFPDKRVIKVSDHQAAAEEVARNNQAIIDRNIRGGGYAALINLGAIRVSNYGDRTSIQTRNLTNKELRAVQAMIDDHVIKPMKGQEIGWGSFEDFTAYMQVPYKEFMSAKFVVKSGNSYELKEAAVGVYKGGPGSGNFDHEGRPGLVGGSSTIAQSIQDFERAHYKDVIEHVAILDKDGNVLVTASGKSDEVDVDLPAGLPYQDGTMTHNHPAWMPFSFEDILCAMQLHSKEVRVTCANDEGKQVIYSLKPLPANTGGGPGPKGKWPNNVAYSNSFFSTRFEVRKLAPQKDCNYQDKASVAEYRRYYTEFWKAMARNLDLEFKEETL